MPQNYLMSCLRIYYLHTHTHTFRLWCYWTRKNSHSYSKCYKWFNERKKWVEKKTKQGKGCVNILWLGVTTDYIYMCFWSLSTFFAHSSFFAHICNYLLFSDWSKPQIMSLYVNKRGTSSPCIDKQGYQRSRFCRCLCSLSKGLFCKHLYDNYLRER